MIRLTLSGWWCLNVLSTTPKHNKTATNKTVMTYLLEIDRKASPKAPNAHLSSNNFTCKFPNSLKINRKVRREIDKKIAAFITKVKSEEAFTRADRVVLHEFINRWARQEYEILYPSIETIKKKSRRPFSYKIDNETYCSKTIRRTMKKAHELGYVAKSSRGILKTNLYVVNWPSITTTVESNLKHKNVPQVTTLSFSSITTKEINETNFNLFLKKKVKKFDRYLEQYPAADDFEGIERIVLEGMTYAKVLMPEFYGMFKEQFELLNPNVQIKVLTEITNKILIKGFRPLDEHGRFCLKSFVLYCYSYCQKRGRIEGYRAAGTLRPIRGEFPIIPYNPKTEEEIKLLQKHGAANILRTMPKVRAKIVARVGSINLIEFLENFTNYVVENDIRWTYEGKFNKLALANCMQHFAKKTQGIKDEKLSRGQTFRQYNDLKAYTEYVAYEKKSVAKVVECETALPQQEVINNIPDIVKSLDFGMPDPIVHPNYTGTEDAPTNDDFSNLISALEGKFRIH